MQISSRIPDRRWLASILMELILRSKPSYPNVCLLCILLPFVDIRNREHNKLGGFNVLCI